MPWPLVLAARAWAPPLPHLNCSARRQPSTPAPGLCPHLNQHTPIRCLFTTAQQLAGLPAPQLWRLTTPAGCCFVVHWAWSQLDWLGNSVQTVLMIVHPQSDSDMYDVLWLTPQHQHHLSISITITSASASPLSSSS
jgi:hypothetical protein